MQPNLSHLQESTPIWLDTLFVITTFLTVGLLYATIRPVSVAVARRFLIASVAWLTGLALLAHYQLFLRLDARPPGFVFVIGLPLLLIMSLVTTAKGRIWVNQLSLSKLTLLHTIRIPVELVLYSLYLHHQIPRLMTFDGRNFDILAGLTAPIVAYFAFRRGTLSARWLFVWTIIALGLVLNIVIQAILSAPFSLQQFGFEQPNVAVLKAPYVWLPGLIVPAVLFSHIVAIQRLSQEIRRTHQLS